MVSPSKPPRHWRIVAEEVAHEYDERKLTALLEELLQALEQSQGQGQLRSENPPSPRGLGKTA